MNVSPSSVHPAEHFHDIFFPDAGITSFMAKSGSAHSSISFRPYSPLSWHLRARVASIQMRLRDRKRELERAHPFG